MSLVQDDLQTTLVIRAVFTKPGGYTWSRRLFIRGTQIPAGSPGRIASGRLYSGRSSANPGKSHTFDQYRNC